MSRWQRHGSWPDSVLVVHRRDRRMPMTEIKSITISECSYASWLRRQAWKRKKLSHITCPSDQGAESTYELSRTVSVENTCAPRAESTPDSHDLRPDAAADRLESRAVIDREMLAETPSEQRLGTESKLELQQTQWNSRFCS